MVLVHTQPVEALRLGKLQLVEEFLIEAARLLGVVQVVRHVHPDRPVRPLEIVGQESIGHEVEEADFHGDSG